MYDNSIKTRNDNSNSSISSAIGWLLLVVGLQVVALQGEETDRAAHALPRWANLALSALQKGTTYLNRRNGHAMKQAYETDGELEVQENVISADGAYSGGSNSANATTSQTEQDTEQNNNGPAPTLAQQVILTAIATLASLTTLYESVYRRVGPQDTTPDDILEAVKRMESQMRRGDSQGQFKMAEDTLTRAQHDMSILGNRPIGKRQGAAAGEQDDGGDLIAEFQRLLWLERAREIDGNMIVIMKGLLGQQAGGVDLMEAISRSTDVTLISYVQEFSNI